MHRIFREALNTATGERRSIIAVIIDIRGFSSFSKTQESYDTAMFLKRVYMNIIDSYFEFASFYKSTGDGLLLTFDCDASNISEMAKKTIEKCIDCHRDFGNICSGDQMVYFEVPDKIGIGVARGTVCCLKSDDKIIDYSGRPLNLTSRLTNLARPSGIVIDESVIRLLDEDTRKKFSEGKVYLDGIAEAAPITVYFTKEFTEIPKRNTREIAGKNWKHEYQVLKFKEIMTSQEWFRHYLKSEPTSGDDIEVKVEHYKVKEGRVSKKWKLIYTFEDFEYVLEAEKPVVRLNFQKLREGLNEYEVRENMEVIIDIAYEES
jgi:class 3 adenylate cyclase